MADHKELKATCDEAVHARSDSDLFPFDIVKVLS
jgi:hypothetical protein